MLQKSFWKKDRSQKLEFKTKKITHNWSVKCLKFSDGEYVLSTIVYGIIANVSPTTKSGRDRLQKWKRKIAIEIKLNRGGFSHSSNSHYSISVGMRFHTLSHQSQKLDLDNYIKPIFDGIAAGLFSDDREDLSQLIRYNQFDDSNFRYLYIERLDDALESNKEGIAIVISKI